jgi:autotransporter-associated beta strand protein
LSTLDLNGTNITLPDGSVFTTPYLTGANDVTNSGLLDATLTEGGGPTGTTYSGTISDGAHATTAITQTSGEVTFTSSNTYSGGTFLEDGTLGIANSGALGDGALTMGELATLLVAGDNLSIANTINVGDADSIDTDDNDLTLTGTITGTGSLSVYGGGQLTLDNADTSSFSGSIDFDFGTSLAVDGAPSTTSTVSRELHKWYRF